MNQLFYGGQTAWVGSGYFSIATSGGRTGSNCLSTWHSTGQWLRQIMPDRQGTWILGTAFKIDSMSDLDLMCVSDGLCGAGFTGNIQWAFGLTSLGGMRIHFGGGGSIVPVGPNVIYRPNAWNYIEAKGTIGHSETISVRMNGGTVYTATGNAQATSNANANVIALGSDNFVTLQFADTYILDGQDASTLGTYGTPTGITGARANNDFLGDVKIVSKFPVADGHYSQWTPKTGSDHYAMVNETNTDYDTTYNSTATPGDKDTFTYQSVDATGDILGVQVISISEKDSAGSRTIENLIRTADDTDVDLDSFALGNTYQSVQSTMDNDPITGTQWTRERLNASEFGVKCNA
jgi:hypothetical protein